MGEKARASTAGWRGRLLAAVLLCAGYALYSSAAYGGALDTALMAALGLDEAAMLLAHTLLMAGSGVGCMAARALAAHGVDLLRMPVCAACYGAVGACLVVAFLLASAPAAVCLLSLMMGLATAVPLLLWFEAFLVAYRSWGPSACLALIAVATLAGRFLGGSRVSWCAAWRWRWGRRWRARRSPVPARGSFCAEILRGEGASRRVRRGCPLPGPTG